MTTTTDSRPAIAYYRVSTARQGESGLGLEAQREAVSRFASASQMEIVGEFTDIESGRKNNRAQLDAAIAAAKKQSAVLVIAKIDRISRRVHFISGLMESGVEFIAADKPTKDRFMLHIEASFAEEEARRISERTKAALAAAKARGVKLGKTGKVQGPKLAKANREAAEDRAAMIAGTVEEIRGAGCSTLQAIADELNRRSIPTAQGKAWHPTSVSRLLKRLDAAERLQKAA